MMLIGRIRRGPEGLLCGEGKERVVEAASPGASAFFTNSNFPAEEHSFLHDGRAWHTESKFSARGRH